MSVFRQISENFFKTRQARDLPVQVQATLKARIHANEVLVRVLQLLLVLFFASVYFISPKTRPDEALEVVPIVLGVYFVLSFIGLIWSIKRDLPDWAVYCSILFDFGLLFGLLVSFHFQYMQPASFILKAPALLYVFIFIALRALRLETRFVVAAGVVAIIGWLAVIYYVTQIDPGDNMLTRSYVTYLTSNSILIGAEVDKIISIAAVTGILVLVVNGANNLLVTAASESSAAKAFSRFFDEGVARGIRRLAGTLKAGEGERRAITVLNVDIRGFSGLAAKEEPSKIMQALSIYQGRVLPIIKAHGGAVDKFMGDGIMATFGLDVINSHCASNALLAAEAILIDSQKWQDEEPLIAEIGKFQIGIGIDSGTVAHGAVGQGDRLEFTVIGSAVNRSAKLEKHNKVLSTYCLASRETWDFAAAESYSGNLQPEFLTQVVDGIDNPEEIVSLTIPQSIPLDSQVAKEMG